MRIILKTIFGPMHFQLFFLFYILRLKKTHKKQFELFIKKKRKTKFWPRSYKCRLKLEIEMAMNNTIPLFNYIWSPLISSHVKKLDIRHLIAQSNNLLFSLQQTWSFLKWGDIISLNFSLRLVDILPLHLMLNIFGQVDGKDRLCLCRIQQKRLAL